LVVQLIFYFSVQSIIKKIYIYIYILKKTLKLKKELVVQLIFYFSIQSIIIVIYKKKNNIKIFILTSKFIIYVQSDPFYKIFWGYI